MFYYIYIIYYYSSFYCIFYSTGCEHTVQNNKFRSVHKLFQFCNFSIYFYCYELNNKKKPRKIQVKNMKSHFANLLFSPNDSLQKL